MLPPPARQTQRYRERSDDQARGESGDEAEGQRE